MWTVAPHGGPFESTLVPNGGVVHALTRHVKTRFRRIFEDLWRNEKELVEILHFVQKTSIFRSLLEELPDFR